MKSYMKTYLIGLKTVLVSILLLLPIGIWWGLFCLFWFIDFKLASLMVHSKTGIDFILEPTEPRAWVFILGAIIIPMCLALYFPIIKFAIKSIKKSIGDLRK